MLCLPLPLPETVREASEALLWGCAMVPSRYPQEYGPDDLGLGTRGFELELPSLYSDLDPPFSPWEDQTGLSDLSGPLGPLNEVDLPHDPVGGNFSFPRPVEETGLSRMALVEAAGLAHETICQGAEVVRSAMDVVGALADAARQLGGSFLR